MFLYAVLEFRAQSIIGKCTSRHLFPYGGLALAEKRASDSEIHEFTSLTACGVRKIVILITTSTACTER